MPACVPSYAVLGFFVANYLQVKNPAATGVGREDVNPPVVDDKG
jgi:hypothetical protein